jgi:hypothetical protein
MTKRKPTNNNKPKTLVLRGNGDYSVGTKNLRDPMTRLEAKIDHLEKSVNKPVTVKNAATSVGRTLGNFVNQGDLGAMAGSALSKYFGHGDYKVKSNSLMGEGKTMVPKFDGKRGTRIQEREFLGDIVSGLTLTAGATDFTSRTFSLNPSDLATFPWLSQVANLYDQWEPHGIVFQFVSTSSEFNGTSQALGAIVMATDYDPFDPAYATKQEMENSDYACSAKPSLGLNHGVECDPAERPTPVLYTSTENGAPLTSTSLGNFQVATKGCSTVGTVLGELWISYDITFYKKQMSNAANQTSVWTGTGTSVAGGFQFGFPIPTLEVGITLADGVFTFAPYIQHGLFECTFVMSAQDVGDHTPVTWVLTNSTMTHNSRTLSTDNQHFYVVFLRVDRAGATMDTRDKFTAGATWQASVVKVNDDLTFA